MNILEILVQKGIINRYQIDDIALRMDQNGEDMDAALAAIGVSSVVLAQVKSELYGIPMRPLNAQNISFEVLKYIPEDSVKYYKFIPIGVTPEGVLEVGMVRPEDMEARNALQFISSKNNIQYETFVISQADFDAAIDNYKGLGSATDDALEDLEKDMIDVDDRMVQGIPATGTIAQTGDSQKIVEDAPVTKMVAVMLQHAVEGRASDIHIEHTGDKVKVRFRVDGTLHTSLMLPKTVHSALVARVKILAKLKLDEKRKPQDGRFPAKINGRKIDFRVSTMPTFYGEKVVMRILDPERGQKTLAEAGMRPDHLALMERMLALPYGLILVTGPTGSGKTTSLYAMLNNIDRDSRNVVSLEDPIEYSVPGMNQSQVHPEIGYTFAYGLRSILRQDPDVIMVGEIRDKETAQLAIQAALTGHLVFATLHTNSAVGVVPRLVDMGVDPYLIAPTLKMAMGQRLVKKIADNAGKQIPIEESVRVLIDRQFEDLPPQFHDMIPPREYLYEPTPTADAPSGLRGRLAVFEMLEIDHDIQHAILTDPTENTIYEIARKKGMLSMKEDAMIKALEGKIPFSEINTL
ncbi:MAG: GspE/PulE family protein [Candidatus Pacebacteria bacterium]|nr:GspE/PulE family protein [Candidatus Paceibacterota bacterium]MCD8508185.1 GspE/PulE family protein [Candidatus Paceibacterota bacterium]MCD8563452.1 GspE/PulE family protein [Candidatus Paceibacterota bacterium]